MANGDLPRHHPRATPPPQHHDPYPRPDPAAHAIAAVQGASASIAACISNTGLEACLQKEEIIQLQSSQSEQMSLSKALNILLVPVKHQQCKISKRGYTRSQNGPDLSLDSMGSRLWGRASAERLSCERKCLSAEKIR
ncbi:uncharacterized protein LOC120681638 [Panicum virgatum]|uniref:uncharacterized protein LOC120681638 n=1 Tax=Panicum virgatum TaxID=38727 RepID=UPI0019D610CF|nr:uncharacterized protein LOC120681638 [Panicum virgatum]XP_039819160.1 uncharacterized protein LOC120681638 [Panicum virgatum]